MKCLFVILMLFAIPAAATNYYVKSAGDNSLSGHTPDSAWATVAKVNGTTLVAGDTIFFNRGDTWTGTNEYLYPNQSGTAASPIVFAAYGTGNKPLFDAENTRTYGIRVLSKNYLTFRDLHFRNGAGPYNALAYFSTVRGIKLINLDIHNAVYAVVTFSGAKKILIDSCSIYNCLNTSGLSCLYLSQTDSSRISHTTLYGPGPTIGEDILSLVTSTYDTVEYCTLYDPNFPTYHSNGIYIKPNSNYNVVRWNTLHDIYLGIQIRVTSNNNIISYNELWNLSLSMQSDGDTAPGNDGNQFLNNTIFNDSTAGNGIHISNTNTNCIIKNNIVYSNGGDCLQVAANSTAGTTSNYNLFRKYSSPTAVMINWGASSYSMNTFSTYKTATGQDGNSITGVPQFADTAAANPVLKLKLNSPAINAGVNVGLSLDHDGYPIVGTPDIGAFEFGSNPVTRYVSTTGSATGAGTRIDPWNITRTLSAASLDTLIIMLGGVYIQDSTATWTLNNRWTADTNLTVAITRANDKPPKITFGNNTTVRGVWFGGLLEDSLRSNRACGYNDSLIWCGFWDTFDDGIASNKYPLVIQNCLFANIGHEITNASTHGIYISSENLPTTADSGYLIQRNVFVGKGVLPDTSSSAYAIQGYHGPKHITARKNFIRQFGFGFAFDGDTATFRDNIVWSNWVGNGDIWKTQEFIYPKVDQSIYYTGNHLRLAHNLFGKIGYATWSGSNPSTDSNYYTNSAAWYPNSTFHPDIGGTGQYYSYRTATSSLLGQDSAQVDVIAGALANALYNKTASEVLAAAPTIKINWQKLLNVVDMWQGTTDEAVTTIPVSTALRLRARIK